MAYKIKFENGHTVSFESEPSESDIDEAFTHTQTLGPKEQPTQEGMRAERVQDFYKDTGKGILETVGAVGSNMLLAPFAGLAGLTQLPNGLDKAVEAIGSVYDKGYQPKTDVGKAGTENVSNILNLPAEYGGKLGEAVAGNEGRLAGEILGEFATDILPLGALKRGKGKAKAPEAPKLDTIEQRLDAMVKKDASNPATGPVTDMRDADLAGYDQVLREPGSVNPYDVGGYVSKARDGVETTIDPEAQRTLFDEEISPNDVPRMEQPDLFSAEPPKPFELTAPEGDVPPMPPREVVKTRLDDPMLLERTPDGGLGEVRPVEPQTLAPTTRESASQKVADGQQFAMTAEERIYWEKTRKVIQEVSDGTKTLSNKEILNKIQDRAWVQDTIDKIVQRQEMFKEIEQRSQDRQAVKMAEKRREVLEDQLTALQEHLSAPRPDTSRAQQGPKTRTAKAIGQRGFANKQTGAFNPEVFTFGMRAVTKKLSALTDRLANDPVWLVGIRKAFDGTEPLKNKDGTPIVLLHGTTADINGGIRGSEQGFHAGYGSDSHFFVQNAGREGSKAYLDPSNQRRNGQMYPVVIKGGNYPKLAADAGDWSPKEILNPNRDSAKPIRDYIADALRRTGYTENQIDRLYIYVDNQVGMTATNQAFSDVLKRAGIDGFFYTNKAESPKSGKLFNLFNRDDVPTRQKIVSQQAQHPESFVTWNNNNFKSVYAAPSTPNQPRDPFKGPGKSQAGATTFFSFGKKDAKELIRDNNSKLNKIEQDLNSLSKSFWQDRSISGEDFRAQQADLLSQQRELEQVNRKWQQTLPPQRETEIHPGYKKIPLGAEVLTDRRGSLERATVRENRQSQFGDTTTWYPRVEFSDGQMKRLLPSDIKKVVRDPFKGPGKGQAGAIRLPFGKKPAVDQLKKIEGIKNDPQMRNIFPEQLSVDEVIKEHAARKTPDVDQNFLQRAANHLTKGSLYQAIKTDNPIVRVVGEKIRQANNYAMAATGRLVHDGLAPLAQKLSKQEKADVWAVQQMAEAKGVTLTPEFLREEGFNQKQIDWVTEHKSVMDDMYQRMSDSMRAAGLEPVSPRVAYVASRARGDFRRLIMKDDKVVGIMGDNTRMGLNKQIERLKAEHPEYKIGEERYYGGRKAKGTEEGFTQMLDFLSKNDPNLKEFVNHVNDMLSQDAFQYMNAKSHTMQKKRVFGMEGRKLYSDAVKNAEEGMQAQIRYAETMIKWSELSKAIAEIKPLLKQDNGLDMPNAKEWANEYIQGALGNSPGKLGDALDSVTAAIGKGTGVGTTVPAKVISAMKSYVNGTLLGFANVGFLTANALQLPRTMPEMAAWLNTKGIEAGYDLGLGRALISVQKQLTHGKLTDLERGAFDYAKKNHVYSSNLFESGNTVSKGLSYYWQKGTQIIASSLERETRKVAFFAYTHMLDEAGIKPSDGLYEAAQNLTDMHMNNYAQAEAPRIYQETGGIGRSAYNLMSFKHNELSRLAMFARNIPKKEFRPIGTAMASQIAFAGLIGTIGFAEADYLYEKITAMMGEPTSLTKTLLDNTEIWDFLKFGAGSLADVDLTSRMGLQLTPGSGLDLVAPGAGKLVDVAGAVGDFATQPNLYNAANVAREALPLSVGGIMDRTVFETEDGMALNRNKVTASAVRNDADKLWKALGMTGVNESVQKKLSYENQKIDQVYKDKRSKVIDGAIKEYYMRGVLPENWVERYVELQGDPKEAVATIKDRIESLNVDRPTKELMKNAASKSVTSQHKLLRRLGKE